MNTRLLLRAAKAAAAMGALKTARRAATERADRQFIHIDPARDTFHEVGTLRFRLPAAWQRTDGFVAYWPVDLEAVKALLPSPQLHPVRIDRDRGLVGVFAFRHFESAARNPDGSTFSLPAYGEAGVYCAVTRRPLPPLVPLLFEWAADVPMGGFVLQLPVTARLHRDGGRAIWGFPKFLADMEFAEDGASRSVHVRERDRTILDLRVEVGGDARLTRAPNVMYSVLDDRLIETTCPSRAFVQQSFRARAELTLGDHPAVRDLPGLRISGRPLAAGIVQQQRFLMPAGRDIGPASARARYAGSDAEFGSFTTRHADGTLVDHYAPDAWQRDGRPVVRPTEASGG
jgi:hypothetical protein